MEPSPTRQRKHLLLSISEPLASEQSALSAAAARNLAAIAAATATAAITTAAIHGDLLLNVLRLITGHSHGVLVGNANHDVANRRNCDRSLCVIGDRVVSNLGFHAADLNRYVFNIVLCPAQIDSHFLLFGLPRHDSDIFLELTRNHARHVHRPLLGFHDGNIHRNLLFDPTANIDGNLLVDEIWNPNIDRRRSATSAAATTTSAAGAGAATASSTSTATTTSAATAATAAVPAGIGDNALLAMAAINGSIDHFLCHARYAASDHSLFLRGNPNGLRFLDLLRNVARNCHLLLCRHTTHYSDFSLFLVRNDATASNLLIHSFPSRYHNRRRNLSLFRYRFATVGCVVFLPLFPAILRDLNLFLSRDHLADGDSDHLRRAAAWAAAAAIGLCHAA